MIGINFLCPRKPKDTLAMLTSVKVQFDACLVHWRGNCPLAGPLIRRGEEDFKATRETGGMPKATPWPSSVFQLRRYTGLAVAEHIHGGREKRPNSREICSSSSDQHLNWKMRNPRSWPSRARDRRPNQTHQRVRTMTSAPAHFIDEGDTSRGESGKRQ